MKSMQFTTDNAKTKEEGSLKSFGNLCIIKGDKEVIQSLIVNSNADLLWIEIIKTHC
jgi:hypothetical protein